MQKYSIIIQITNKFLLIFQNSKRWYRMCGMHSLEIQPLENIFLNFHIYCLQLWGICRVIYIEALIYIEKLTHNKFIIFSNSKSVLLAIQNLESNNSIIQNIIKMNVKLKNINKNVFFSRIPVHIGIKDNEKILTKLACIYIKL